MLRMPRFSSFTDIRLEHRGGVRTERAIHEDFDGANAQPVIAEARAQTKLICLIEQFNGNVLEHAQFEFALRMKLLQCHE